MDGAYAMEHARLYLERGIDFDIKALNNADFDGSALEGVEEFLGDLGDIDLGDLAATLN